MIHCFAARDSKRQRAFWGNLQFDGSKTYAYDSDNQLKGVTGAATATLTYDPQGRLQKIAGSATTQFLYDGGQAIAEYDGAATPAVLRRYVPGAGADETVVALEGSGTTLRSWLLTDMRGSVVGLSNASGTVTAINKYDEYGTPQAGNTGRFQYTGQMWLHEIGVYYYKARTYHPGLGRFMQTDPIGFAGGMNLYAYVGNDPLNATDPTGLKDEIFVTAKRRSEGPSGAPLSAFITGASGRSIAGGLVFDGTLNQIAGDINQSLCGGSPRPQARAFFDGFSGALQAYPVIFGHQSGVEAGNANAIAVDRALGLAGAVLANPNNAADSLAYANNYLNNNIPFVAGRVVGSSVSGLLVGGGLGGRASQVVARQFGKSAGRALPAASGAATALANFTVSQQAGALSALYQLSQSSSAAGTTINALSIDSIYKAALAGAVGLDVDYDPDTGGITIDGAPVCGG